MMKSLAVALTCSALSLFAACATAPPASAEPVMTHVSRPDSCADCGTVSSIESIEKKGGASGAGAVIGAVIGGVVGHQFGQGKGQDAATVGGAVAGGFAGHEAEKRHNEETSYYKVSVNMDSGYTRSVNLGSVEGVGVGTRVRLVGNDMEIVSN
jgi:outer membrane lipoprotein SlyB